MNVRRQLPALIAMSALLLACSDDGTSSGTTTETTAASVATTTESATTIQAATTTTAATALAQPAIWPAAGVMFATPQEAAADFISSVLGVEPLLGDFVGGDARSGEIEVFSPGETTPISRSLLDLRQLAPSEGWFVIGAGNPHTTISTPEVYAEVAAGDLTVAGVGRGFEGTVVVTAFVAGHAEQVLDQVITSGGAYATAEPYSVTIDLSAASPGDIVTLLVHGDTGLENDPGEFSAIAVVITA